MRHKRGNKKLSKPTDQRIAMLKSLSVSLFRYKKIETTQVRAKELQRFSDRIITLIKKEDLNSRRRVISMLLDDKDLVKSLYANMDGFKARNSGYSRVIRTGLRRGDAAQMALVELV